MIPAFCEGCEHITHYPAIKGPEGQPMEAAEEMCPGEFNPLDPGCPRHVEYLEEKQDERDED